MKKIFIATSLLISFQFASAEVTSCLDAEKNSLTYDDSSSSASFKTAVSSKPLLYTGDSLTVLSNEFSIDALVGKNSVGETNFVVTFKVVGNAKEQLLKAHVVTAASGDSATYDLTCALPAQK